MNPRPRKLEPVVARFAAYALCAAVLCGWLLLRGIACL